MLGRVPETRPVARALEARSAGIKDLGHGYLVDEDWSSESSGSWSSESSGSWSPGPSGSGRSAGREIPFLSTARYYFVSAGGFGLVGRASAWAQPGAGEPLRFPVDHYREIGGVGQLDLLDHPVVYGVLRDWLGGARPALPAPRRGLPPAQRP